MSLKDRIAAIQQREERDRAGNITGNGTNNAAASVPASSSAGALRAKIAQFESKGGVPIPRGSFGLGAPPEQKPKSRTELYGNRLQPVRLPSATLAYARPIEAFATSEPRAVALPPDDDDDLLSPVSETGSGHPSPPRDHLRRARSPAGDAPAAPKSTVPSRGTNFATALEIARKAEADVKANRRHSALLLQPQFTGSLTPQHTGGISLTPQHTGGSGLVPQFTGSSLVRQNTGGSTGLFSPPLSPYSPGGQYSPRSPTLSTGATSPTRFLAEDQEQAFVVAEPEEEEELPQVEVHDVDVFDAYYEAAPPPEDEDLLENSRTADAAPASSPPPPSSPPHSSTPTHIPASPPSSSTHIPASPPSSSSHIPASPPPSSSTTSAVPTAPPTLNTHDIPTSFDGPETATASVDSCHADLDLDAHLYSARMGGLQRSASPSAESDSDKSFSAGLDGDGALEEHGDEGGDVEDGLGLLAPLSNTLYSHRFRKHLSTITERSIEPGSPGWNESRFSAAYDRESGDGEEERGGGGSFFSYGASGMDGGDGDDRDHEEDEGERERERERREKEAGVGSGMRALKAVPSRFSTYAAYSYPDEQGEDGGEKDDGDGEEVADAVVLVRARENAPSPSPYRLSGLTDRGYTPSLRSEDEDGRRSVHDDEPEVEDAGVHIRVDDAEGETGTPEQRQEQVEDDEEEPPTPFAEPRTPVATTVLDELLAVPDTPQTQQQPDSLQPSIDGAPSQRSSLLSLASSAPGNPQRDSLLSTHTRDSLISSTSEVGLHTQTITLRRESTLTLDSGSPSHVALAHRVPVVDSVAGVERGVELFVPGPASPGFEQRVAEPEEVPRTPERERARSAEAEDVITASPTRRRPLPSTQAARPSTTYEVESPRTPPRRHAYTSKAAAAVGRPHTTYLPDDEDAGVDEFGTISFGAGPAHSFSAIVHGRVREQPNTWNGKSNRSMDMRRGGDDKSLPPMPLSPGYATGELAELLAEAAALELRLEKGELPADARRRLSRMSMRLPPPGAAPAMPPPPIPPIPEQYAGAALKSQRSLRNPLARSRSEYRPKGPERDEGMPVASASTSNLLVQTPTTLMRSQSSVAAPQVVTVPPLSPNGSDIPPTPPPKSPGARYFSSLRRLASSSRVTPGLGAVTPGTRGSVSTSSELSSEDSMGLPTPPDDAATHHSTGTGPPNHSGGIAWPSLSTKKSVGSIGRGAASLAGKMFHRTRSKSSTSTASSVETSSPPPMPVPAMPAPPALKLDPAPWTIPRIPTGSHEPDDTPTNKIPHPHPLITPTVTVPAPKIKSSASARPTRLVLHNGDRYANPAGLLPVPKTAPENRRESWMSVSTTGSSSATPSPLFDKAIFDAFPSVPELPSQQTPLSAHARQLPSPSTSLGRSGSTSPSMHPLPVSSPGSSGMPSPPGSGRILPGPGFHYSDSSSISTPALSESSFGTTTLSSSGSSSYGTDNLLARVAQTQQHVNLLP